MNPSAAWEWNGHHWSADLPPPGANVGTSAPEVAAVSCAPKRTCMAMNASHQAFLFSNGRWTHILTLPSLPSDSQALGQQVGSPSVSCPTASSCTAIEANGFAFRWNGRQWERPLDALPPGNEYVSCPEAKWCMFMNSQSYEAIWDGDKWSGAPVFVDPQSMEIGQPSGETSPVSWGQADYGLLDLSCPSKSLCVAVDDSGYAVSFNGKTWSTPKQMAEGGDSRETVSCSTSVCMVANNFKVVIGRP